MHMNDKMCKYRKKNRNLADTVKLIVLALIYYLSLHIRGVLTFLGVGILSVVTGLIDVNFCPRVLILAVGMFIIFCRLAIMCEDKINRKANRKTRK